MSDTLVPSLPSVNFAGAPLATTTSTPRSQTTSWRAWRARRPVRRARGFRGACWSGAWGR